MRRVEQLITQIRRATENIRIGTQDGISDEEFIQYLNDAQELAQSAIVAARAKVYVKSSVLTPDGTELVSIPTDIWADQRIIVFEYSPSGADADYRPLKRVTLLERRSTLGWPSQYSVRGNKVIVNSYPASGNGSYRITYEYKLPTLDKLRGVVASRTFSAPSLTALTIAPSGFFVQGDYSLNDYLCILKVDKSTVEMKGVFIDSVNASGVATLNSSLFTAQTGETLTVGSYVLLGQNAVNRPLINDLFEKWLLVYSQRRIFDRDSSDDRKTMTMDEQAMMADLIQQYGDLSGDEDQIVINEFDYFDPDELS